MKMTHIAWLGDHNFGDDIMANAIWDACRERFSPLHTTVWCDKMPTLPAHTSWIYPFLLPYGYGQSFFERRALDSSDLLVIGGGSVLHSQRSSNWKRAAVETLKRRHPNKKAVGISLSVGPFDSTEDEKACVRFLQSLDGCALRESASFAFASSLDLPYKPIAAFDVCGAYLAQRKLMQKPTTVDIQTVGVSLRLPYRTDTDIVTANYAALLRELASRFERIRLFSFSNDRTHYEQAYCERVKQISGIDRIDIVPYTDHHEQFTRAMRETDFFITTKLHGLLLSFLMNIPCTSISYQKKFEDFCSDIHLPPEHQWTQANFDPVAIADSVAPYAYVDQTPFFEAAQKNFDVLRF